MHKNLVGVTLKGHTYEVGVVSITLNNKGEIMLEKIIVKNAPGWTTLVNAKYAR